MNHPFPCRVGAFRHRVSNAEICEGWNSGGEWDDLQTCWGFGTCLCTLDLLKGIPKNKHTHVYIYIYIEIDSFNLGFLIRKIEHNLKQTEVSHLFRALQVTLKRAWEIQVRLAPENEQIRETVEGTYPI